MTDKNYITHKISPLQPLLEMFFLSMKIGNIFRSRKCSTGYGRIAVRMSGETHEHTVPIVSA